MNVGPKLKLRYSDRAGNETGSLNMIQVSDPDPARPGRQITRLNSFLHNQLTSDGPECASHMVYVALAWPWSGRASQSSKTRAPMADDPSPSI